MDISKGYIIMLIGAVIVLLSVIGFIAVTIAYHRKKENLMKSIYEE